jgi:hypothetical protein
MEVSTMTPSTHVEVPPTAEEEQARKPETVVAGIPEAKSSISKVPSDMKPKAGVQHFQSSMIENNRIKSSSKMLDDLIALFVNAVILAGPILAGLIYTDTLNIRQFESTFLIAPPPPPRSRTLKKLHIHPIVEQGEWHGESREELRAGP